MRKYERRVEEESSMILKGGVKYFEGRRSRMKRHAR
jgi:hypothetical protein